MENRLFDETKDIKDDKYGKYIVEYEEVIKRIDETTGNKDITYEEYCEIRFMVYEEINILSSTLNQQVNDIENCTNAITTFLLCKYSYDDIPEIMNKGIVGECFKAYNSNYNGKFNTINVKGKSGIERYVDDYINKISYIFNVDVDLKTLCSQIYLINDDTVDYGINDKICRYLYEYTFKYFKSEFRDYLEKMREKIYQLCKKHKEELDDIKNRKGYLNAQEERLYYFYCNNNSKNLIAFYYSLSNYQKNIDEVSDIDLDKFINDYVGLDNLKSNSIQRKIEREARYEPRYREKNDDYNYKAEDDLRRKIKIAIALLLAWLAIENTAYNISHNKEDTEEHKNQKQYEYTVKNTYNHDSEVIEDYRIKR